jgi:hypothetical protein
MPAVKTFLGIVAIALFWAFLAASLLSITVGVQFCACMAGLMGC